MNLKNALDLGVSNLESLLERHGFVDIDHLFDWWYEVGSDGTSLINLVIEEQRLFQYHTAKKGKDENGYLWL